MASKSPTLKAMQASAAAPVPPRLGVRAVIACTLLQVLLLFALMLMFPGLARSEPLRGDIRVSTNAGYARLVFTFGEENDADVRLANGIVVISFKKPVDVNVDRITSGASGYVGVARRDPDGTAVRIALTRKVTVNSMAGGGHVFVDPLPVF